MSANVFEMRNGRAVLDGNVVFDAVDLQIAAGEGVALLGQNGSGKTTLVRALLGLVRLAEGEATIFGVGLDRFRDWQRIGYVPQRFAVRTAVPATAGEVVLSGRIARRRRFRRFGTEDRDAAERALAAVDLVELAGRKMSSLSGGQQQRVLVARALASDPDVLVLDEPVSSVDLEHRAALARLLTSEQRRRTILLVAHSLAEMADVVDRCLVLERGRIAYDGPPDAAWADDDHIHHEPQPSRRAISLRHIGDAP